MIQLNGPPRGALDVTVLAGGVGVEREVSLQSGRAVHAALVRLGHRAALRDVSPADLSPLHRPCDFFFIALHGEFGEDGAIQRALDRVGVPYAGSDAAASALAFDKRAAKEVFARHGLPTPPHHWVTADNVELELELIRRPCVVKPAASGSSVDVTIARTREQTVEAVTRLVRQYGAALVERYIDGPELTVGVLGDSALPVCQIVTRREFYDYQAKYLDDDTEYRFEIDLPPELLAQVQTYSVRAHRLLGCRAFSRADWMVEGRTLQPYLLEVNTIPGFTTHSLLPKAAARVGIGFDELCQRIIELSMTPSCVTVDSTAAMGREPALQGSERG